MEKSPFWQHNALFASKAKINIFLYFFRVEGPRSRWPGVKNFFQKNVDFSLWGTNHATTQKHIWNWIFSLHFSSLWHHAYHRFVKLKKCTSDKFCEKLMDNMKVLLYSLFSIKDLLPPFQYKIFFKLLPSKESKENFQNFWFLKEIR